MTTWRHRYPDVFTYLDGEFDSLVSYYCRARPVFGWLEPAAFVEFVIIGYIGFFDRSHNLSFTYRICGVEEGIVFSQRRAYHYKKARQRTACLGYFRYAFPGTLEQCFVMEKVGAGICRYTHFGKNDGIGTGFVGLMRKVDYTGCVGCGVCDCHERRGCRNSEKSVFHIFYW